MMHFIINLFLFFLGWSSALAVTSWLRLPNVIIFLLFITSIIPIIYNRKILKDISILPVTLFIIGMILSVLLNFNSSSSNYLLSYIFFWGGYYFLLVNVFLLIEEKVLFKWIFRGVLFTLLFVVANWLFSFIGVSLQGSIPRLNEPGVTYTGTSRAYGLSTEPGTLAFYLNSFAPICFYYLKSNFGTLKNRVYIFGFITLYLFSLVLSGSASGFAVLGILVLILLVINVQKSILEKKYFQILTLSLLVITSMFVVFYLVKNFAPSILDSIIGKISLNENSNSVLSRLDKVEAAKIIFEKSNVIFGAGPGYHSSIGLPGAGNWFLMILLEMGVWGLVTISSFVAITSYRIFRLKGLLSICLLLSFTATVAHLFLISTFFHPYFFVVAALVTRIYFDPKHHNKKIL